MKILPGVQGLMSLIRTKVQESLDFGRDALLTEKSRQYIAQSVFSRITLMDSESDDVEGKPISKTQEELEPEESNKRIDVLLRVITLLVKKNTPEPKVVV